jgi:hypothetical protein
MHVKSGLEHVWSGRASDKERGRTKKTEQETKWRREFGVVS